MREEDSVGSPYRNHHLGTIADILRRIVGRSFVQIVDHIVVRIVSFCAEARLRSFYRHT
jgi:hypothetical protein